MLHHGMRSLKVAASLLAGILAITALLGCVLYPHPAPANAKPEVIPPPAKPVPAAQITALLQDSYPIDPSPLRPYVLTSTGAALINYAEDVITSRCMADFGFDYPVPDFDQMTQAAQTDARSSLGRIYGLSNAGDARQFGYDYPRTSAARPQYAIPTSADYRLLLYGGNDKGAVAPPSPGQYKGKQIPAGGCVGSAQRAVENEVKPSSGADPINLGADKVQQASLYTKADPRYSDIQAQWSACMATKGYHFDTFNEPFQTSIHTGTSTTPQAEINTAAADMNCKDTLGTMSQIYSISAEYEQQLLDEAAGSLNAQKQRIDAELAIATRMITTGDYSTS